MRNFFRSTAFKILLAAVVVLLACVIAAAAFSGNVEDMPSVTLALTADATIPEIMTAAGAAGSRSEARRLIEGGGVRLNDTKVSDVNDTPASLGAGTSFVLHKVKKLHVRIELR